MVHSPSIHRRAPGFTLVEMLITVVITGILAAVAMPQFTQFRASKGVNSMVSTLAGDFRLARSEAIKRNQNVTLCRSSNPEAATPQCDNTGTEWTSGWIMFEDLGLRASFDPASDTLIKAQPAMVNWGSITAPAGYFITYRNVGMPVQGGATVPNGTITVYPSVPAAEQKTSKLRRGVVISVAGRVRVQAPPPPSP